MHKKHGNPKKKKKNVLVMLSFFFFKCQDGQVSHFICSVAEGGGQLYSSKSNELSKALKVQKKFFNYGARELRQRMISSQQKCS